MKNQENFDNILSIYLDKWINLSRSTDLIDLDKVKDLILNLYKELDMNKEPSIVYCRSPKDFSKYIQDNGIISEQLSNIDLYEILHQKINIDYVNLKKNILVNITNKVDNLYLNNVKTIRSQLAIFIIDHIYEYSSAPYDYFWMEYMLIFDIFINELGYELTNTVKIILELLYNIPFYLMLNDYCFIFERPQFISLNENNKLHNLDRPAIVWNDGTYEYYINGISIPSYIVTEPQKITEELIDEEQDEDIKLIMIDKYLEIRKNKEK